jgi:hypothetical protein
MAALQECVENEAQMLCTNDTVISQGTIQRHMPRFESEQMQTVSVDQPLANGATTYGSCCFGLFSFTYSDVLCLSGSRSIVTYEQLPNDAKK